MKKILILVILFLFLGFNFYSIDEKLLKVCIQKTFLVHIDQAYFIEQLDTYAWDSYLLKKDDSKFFYPIYVTMDIDQEKLEIIKSKKYDIYLVFYINPFDDSYEAKEIKIEKSENYHELKILKKVDDLPEKMKDRLN